MSTVATVTSSAAGVTLVAVAVRDVFDALFHPEGRSTLTRGVMRGVWRFARRGTPGGGRLVLAGPVGLLLVVATWALLLISGWALVFLPHIEGGFHRATGAPGGDLAEALYVSVVTLTTLGFGDVTPEATWLRLIGPLEALVGFGLLSASISWLLLIHPALARRRSLAYEISLLRKAEDETGVPLHARDADGAAQIYGELTSRLVAVERDLVNFPVSYYFSEADERFSLPFVAGWLLGDAERAGGEEMPDHLRFRARLLLEALEDLGATAAARFHGARGGDAAERLLAYARDHGRA